MLLNYELPNQETAFYVNFMCCYRITEFLGLPILAALYRVAGVIKLFGTPWEWGGTSDPHSHSRMGTPLWDRGIPYSYHTAINVSSQIATSQKQSVYSQRRYILRKDSFCIYIKDSKQCILVGQVSAQQRTGGANCVNPCHSQQVLQERTGYIAELHFEQKLMRAHLIKCLDRRVSTRPWLLVTTAISGTTVSISSYHL